MRALLKQNFLNKHSKMKKIKIYYTRSTFYIFDQVSAEICVFNCHVYGDNMSYFCSFEKNKAPTKLPITLGYFEYNYLIQNHVEKVETFIYKEETWLKTEFPISNDLIDNFDKKKCLVYDELRKKQFHVTVGDKFGCDFLLYPSCVLQCHAITILKILNHEENMNNQDIALYARLAGSVKKTFMVAKVNNKDEISFSNFES